MGKETSKQTFIYPKHTKLVISQLRQQKKSEGKGAKTIPLPATTSGTISTVCKQGIL
jgi:hypothetical protein